MQIGYVTTIDEVDQFVELPDSCEKVINDVLWGDLCAFPTPSFWKYQVLARRILGEAIRYRLGNSLREEVGACLLGGHGIPASVGLAAFEHLRLSMVFDEQTQLAEQSIYNLLSEPLAHKGKFIKYRFARQKARYLAAAMGKLSDEEPPMESGQSLRNWLIDIPGIGYKTSSWVARNWLDADDVAILDIHILRAGQISGFIDQNLKVERHYVEIERQFLDFSRALGVRSSELDAVIWLEMMSSPLSVKRALEASRLTSDSGTSRTKNRHSNTNQLSFGI